MDYSIPTIEHSYVIFDPNTGLYSKGGSYKVWRKKPKVWANIGHLKNHLNMFLDYRGEIYGGCPYQGHEEVHDIIAKEKLWTVRDYYWARAEKSRLESIERTVRDYYWVY